MPFSASRRVHTLFMMLTFAAFGVSTEVVFTAFTSLITQEPMCDKPLASMAGRSYVWMLFIYGAIPLFAFYIYNRVKHLHVLVRLFLYVLIVYVVEFTTGYILQLATGKCPWQYTSGWHVMGLIRLDYFPAWAIFCWLVERLYVFVNNRMVQ